MGKQKCGVFVVVLALVCAIGQFVVTVPARADEAPAGRDARMKWWREARFGMFIHWGIYSVPAGTYHGSQIGGLGEWIMHEGRIPVAEYKKFAGEFNPVKFDADQWVRLAEEAGQKYIVITSKHHDGFAMYRSAANPFNICDATPFNRDPLKELAAACRKHSIKLGVYYSQAQDWTAPGGASMDGRWDQAQEGEMDEYLNKKALPQVKEILTRFGPIAVLWWDTPCDMSRERADKFLPLLKLQPGIICNDRLGGGLPGDFGTPEQSIPATGIPGRDWETCMTMNDTWGYKSYDQNWKSTETLIRNLIDIASKGGNYLLNVGPTSEGEIPAPIVTRLKEVGRWMKQNGEAIYATQPNPFERPPAWGRVTRKPGKLYLNIFSWPQDRQLELAGLGNKVDKAYLLADPNRVPLSVSQRDGLLKISIPQNMPDPIASVVVAEYSGELEIAVPRTAQEADGRLILKASAADIHGQTL